jgi:hypothetical protein
MVPCQRDIAIPLFTIPRQKITKLPLKIVFKGHSHEIFCFRGFFHEFPKAPEKKNIWVILNFFENYRGDICKSRLTNGINDTGGKFATGTAGLVDTGTVPLSEKNERKYLDGRFQESEGVLAQGDVLQVHMTLEEKIKNNK